MSRWARLAWKACKTSFTSGSLISFLALEKRKEDGERGWGGEMNSTEPGAGAVCQGPCPHPWALRESWCFLNSRQGLGWLQPSPKAFTFTARH